MEVIFVATDATSSSRSHAYQSLTDRAEGRPNKLRKIGTTIPRFVGIAESRYVQLQRVNSELNDLLSRDSKLDIAMLQLVFSLAARTRT